PVFGIALTELDAAAIAAAAVRTKTVLLISMRGSFHLSPQRCSNNLVSRLWFLTPARNAVHLDSLPCAMNSGAPGIGLDRRRQFRIIGLVRSSNTRLRRRSKAPPKSTRVFSSGGPMGSLRDDTRCSRSEAAAPAAAVWPSAVK